MKRMQGGIKNLGVVGFIFLIIFFGVLFLPISHQNVIGKNVVSTIGKLDFGNGKNNLTTNKDSQIYPSSDEYNSVIISNKLVVPKSVHNGVLSIKAQKSIYITKSGSIDYSGAGLATTNSNIKPTTPTESGSGGSSGGAGGSGTCNDVSRQKIDPGLLNINLAFGKAGLANTLKNNDSGGSGGGYILLESPKIIIDGSVISNGKNGFESGGGGGGGKIVILTNYLSVTGLISAKGGVGGTSFTQGAGGGGGGIVVLSVNKTGDGKIDVSGGPGGNSLDIYTGCDGQPGSDGIIATP